MGNKGNIDHKSKTSLAHTTGASENHPQHPGHSIGIGHRRSETLSHHGGPAHQVGGGGKPRGYGKSIMQGGKNFK